MFDGRAAHYAGIAFSGSARDVYWSSIVRGVRREITSQLEWVDQQVRSYNRETALTAVDECAGALASFARSIRREAVKKDRILRGDGTNFPPENDAGWWEGTDAADIQAQANALKAALPFAALQTGFRARSLAFWNANQGWLQVFGIIAAVVIGIAAIITAR